MVSIWYHKFDKSRFYSQITDKDPDVASIIGVDFENLFNVLRDLGKKGYSYKISNAGKETTEIIACKGSILDYRWVTYSNSICMNGILFVRCEDNGQELVVGSTILDPGHELSQFNCLNGFFREYPRVVVHCHGAILGDLSDWDLNGELLTRGVNDKGESNGSTSLED